MVEGVLEVEPFQDIFYDSCIDNPIISLIYSARGEILPVLQNDVFYYEGQELLSVKRQGKADLYQLLKEEGFDIQVMYAVTDLTSVMKRQQKEKNYLFVPVDACYMPAIKELYKKEHHPNFMLVLKESDGIVTYINTIGFDTAVRTCCKEELFSGYQSEYNKEKDVRVISYKGRTSDCTTELSAREYFLCNYRENRKLILQGINELEEFLQTLTDKQDTPKVWAEFYDSNRFFFQTVLPHRIVPRIELQYYQHSKLFHDFPTIVNLRKMIWEEWKSIKTILHKYSLNHTYHKSSFVRVIESVQKVCILEKEYILTMEWSHL